MLQNTIDDIGLGNGSVRHHCRHCRRSDHRRRCCQYHHRHIYFYHGVHLHLCFIISHRVQQAMFIVFSLAKPQTLVSVSVLKRHKHSLTFASCNPFTTHIFTLHSSTFSRGQDGGGGLSLQVCRGLCHDEHPGRRPPSRCPQSDSPASLREVPSEGAGRPEVTHSLHRPLPEETNGGLQVMW